MGNLVAETAPDIKPSCRPSVPDGVQFAVQFSVGVSPKRPTVRRSMKLTVSAIVVFLCGQLLVLAQEAEWAPEANMDHQLFPSLIIATASVRPVEPDDEEAAQPDSSLLGERFGLVGISIKGTEANAKIKVTVKENELMAESSWTGEL